MPTSSLGVKLLFPIGVFGNFSALSLKLTEKLPNYIKSLVSLLLCSLVHGKHAVFRSMSLKSRRWDLFLLFSYNMLNCFGGF